MPRKGGVKENLVPFKEGKDARRNLKGRPKLPDIEEALARVLSGTADKSEAEAILEALRKKAKAGDVKAAEYLLNRGYGKPKETHEIKDITPITQVEIIHTDASKQGT